MTVIRPMKLDEIEEHLIRLGAGNHSDNMARLRQYQCYLCMAMNEDDFLSTVFLQNEEVLTIAPRGDSRSLRNVASRAIDSKLRVLSSNWDLNRNLERMRRQLASGDICLDSPVLCETRTSEKKHGAWYLQDGSHRSLAYAMLVLMGEVQYGQQIAFCAMGDRTAAALIGLDH